MEPGFSPPEGLSAREVSRSAGAERTVSSVLPVLFVAFQAGKLANGGIESLSQILARLRRVRPILVTQTESAVTERWRAAGHEVHVWQMPAASGSPQRRRGLAHSLTHNLPLVVAGNLRVARFLRDRAIRVVHCNDAWASMSVSCGARLAGARVVLNIRDTLLVNLPRWKLLRGLSHRVVVLSEEMRRDLERRLAPPAWALGRGATPLTSIYSIVDTERMRPLAPDVRAELRARLGIERDEVAVGVVGALMPKKQQLALIGQLNARASSLPPNVRLYFVGDAPATDPYSSACQRAAFEGPLANRIRFVGYTPQVECWHQALDLALMASEFEGLARSMIESIACATPVIAFACCSAREILEQNQCGLVVAMNDFDALVDRLRQLVQDPVQRRHLGANGPEFARRAFAPERIVAEYERVYLELAKA